MMRLLSITFLMLVAAVASASNVGTTSSRSAVSLEKSGNLVTLSNGYIRLAVDCMSHRMVAFSADHTGHGRFHVQLLGPGGLQIEQVSGIATGDTCVVRRTAGRASVSMGWGPASGRKRLAFTLQARGRGVHVEASLPQDDSIRLILHQWFLLGIFQRGVVQYVAGQDQYFSSVNPLRLFYTIDRKNGSVALVPDKNTPPRQVALLSGRSNQVSGILLRPQAVQNVNGRWRIGMPQAAAPGVATKTLRLGFTLYGNDLPFPNYRKDSYLNTLSQQQAREMAAYYTATYASAAGVLGSYHEAGSAYPTLAHPKRPYGDAFDFFDPDAWETVTTLAYSGDPLLQREARRILERSERSQLPDGQIPHHFVRGVPTFLSIAGSSQTGPNIFWTLAAINYADATGNEKWLRSNYPHLRLATNWLLASYSPRWKLVRANGPLFIDVFRRSGYTLDTNAFLYYLLKRMTGVAVFCNDPGTAKRYAAMRRDLREGMLRNLWNGRDHFITERKPDGTARDFVDYDGNFAALAFGVLRSKKDAHKLLLRLDRGSHLHPGGFGTWVSERRYGKADCYKGNVGDSDVAMARIWWLDMKARVKMGDIATFNSLFSKTEGDILQNVWLPERFNAEGRPAHNSYYHEYPEVFSMIVREMQYGVNVSQERVMVRPFGIHRFTLNLGPLRVDYSRRYIVMRIPGTNPRTFVIEGLEPRRKYILGLNRYLRADRKGAIRFTARAGKTLVIREVGISSVTTVSRQ